MNPNSVQELLEEREGVCLAAGKIFEIIVNADKCIGKLCTDVLRLIGHAISNRRDQEKGSQELRQISLGQSGVFHVEHSNEKRVDDGAVQ